MQLRSPPLRSSRSCSRHSAVSVVCLHRAYSQRVQQAKPLQQPATPAEFTLECLTALRKGDVSALSPYISPEQLAPEGAPVSVAGVPVVEHGPLARCSPFMDAAARRVLPGHLLRRCRVLSSLSLGGSCIQRVGLTACTGEEVVLTWRLQPQESDSTSTQHSDSSWSDTSNPSSSTTTTTGSSSSSGGTSSSTSSTSSTSIGADSAYTATQQCGSPAASSAECQQPASHTADSTSGQVSSSSSSSTPQQSHQTTPDSLPTAAAEEGDGDASASHQPPPSPPSPAPPTAGAEDLAPPAADTARQWCIASIHYNAADAGTAGALPSQPHLRHPPETIILAQLAALRSGDLHAAAGFNVWGRQLSAGWLVQLAAFEQLLSRPECRLLRGHAAVHLASAACPLPRQFLQEVVLTGPTDRASSRGRRQTTSSSSSSEQGGGPQEQRFLWRMAMRADGCWLVKAIEAL